MSGPLATDLAEHVQVTVQPRGPESARRQPVPATAWLGWRRGRVVAWYGYDRAMARALTAGWVEAVTQATDYAA